MQKTSNDTIMGVLSYLGILVIIPILAAKDSQFARFHASQGLTLLLCSVVYSIATWVITIILGFVSLTVAAVVSGLLGLLSIAFFVLAILGIINAVQGNEKELPFIGQFKILK